MEDQRNTNFDFDQKIQLNVTGVIGEKLKISTNYNTEASFDFENQIKLGYEGNEDEIIKSIELGHVSMPLNTSLIKGSQSLFGVKSTLQFGKLRVTSVLSQQKSQTQSQEVTGGVQKKVVEITADNYDDNRHFYLAQYFHDEYDSAMASLPVVQSPIQINQLEVWITNIGVNTNPDARNVIALMDLAERTTYDPDLIPNLSSAYPNNGSNNLYDQVANDPTTRNFISASGQLISSYGYESGVHFEKIENAKRLDPSEYTYHSQLGYISLDRKVADNEVLAVAYEYTVPGENFPRQVGEFANDIADGGSSLFLKLLKSTQVNNTKLPLWTLMMKNVYSTGQYGIDAATLDIDIYYNDPKSNNDINYLPAGSAGDKPIRWLELLNMDQLDPQLNNVPDGRYDIIEGLTVRLQNGRIYFPVNQPFGSFMRAKINNETVANQYAFDSLYTVPKWKAKNEFPTKNRFKVMTRFESKNSTIRLNAFNIPEGAVTVTAGGRQLVEGVDFRVDRTSGEVTILNQSILNSNTPIKVDVESNSLFAVTNKTLFGAHLDYEVSKDWTIGGTIFNLTESPLRNKTNQGDEPISNTIWGLNTNYAVESPYLTKLVDKIPFIDTKAPSKIETSAEFAQLIPGSPSAIENDGEALSYIDDFEAGQINITVKDRISWKLASTPQGQTRTGEWPEGSLTDSLDYGFNRAKLSWYNVDALFYDNSTNTPDHIKDNDRIQFNHYMRSVPQSELFPNRSLPIGEALNLLTLDVSYFPEERGPYNFDTEGGIFSQGIDKVTGLLNDPQSRWGGMMRQVRNVDFETQNIEFLEFWVMSPFLDDQGDMTAVGGTKTGGDVYFHLGNVSEDILKDGRKGFENGLPTDGSSSSGVDTTNWGRVSSGINLVSAFDNDPTTRQNQDVGLDGLSNANETSFFSDYLSYYGGAVPAAVAADPSADDYQYFWGTELDNSLSDIVGRYKKFAGLDGNSPTQDQTGLAYNSTSTNIPDIEDVNRDNTLSEGESYYQYKISMRPEDLEGSDVGTNYLNQVYNTTATHPNGSTKDVTWYQFRIPVREPDKVIGSISDFQAIRFMRMAFKDWEAPVVMRFATMDFVQSRWRTYNDNLLDEGEYVASQSSTVFNVGSVNLEEDSKKQPVRYIMPPDIQRQFNVATRSQENEQAMQLKVCDLEGGDARAMYKFQNFDLLSYNQMLMNVHAETGDNNNITDLSEMNMSVFLRIGSDFNNNYYEYEVPLVFTDPDLVSATSNESAEKEIWKSENLFDFNYKDVFSGLKAERNNEALLNSEENGTLSLQRYSKADGRNTAFVKGSPSLQQVKVIMIGVRNKNEPGVSRCAEVWVNELRLSGFDKTGGWATTANINMQLADLGNVSFGGGYSTPGWGSIDQKVSDRAREHTRNIDATTSLQMGKFFPEKVGLSIPVYMGYNEIKKTPQYNPLDTDIKIEELDKNSDYRKYLDTIVTDLTQSRSLNFSNVRKLPKGNKKLKVYSIENFDATYAVSDKRQRDVNTEYANVKNYQAALNYKFNLRPKPVQPFKRTPIMNKVQKKKEKKYDEQEKELNDSINTQRKLDSKSPAVKQLETQLKALRVEKKDYKKRMAKLKRSKYLRLYRDFNFYYLPKSFAIKNDMNRMFSEHKIRNVSTADLLIEPTYNKNWYYNRTYRLDYDLTKAVKLDYSAQRKAFIDEPFGAIDSKEKQDSIWRSIGQSGIGRATFFTQTTNANWKIPINKFPWTNWISSSVKYSGKYDWQAAPLSTTSLGNNISNSNTKQLLAQFNMINLYNKVPYLKKLNRRSRSRAKPKKKTNPSDTTKKSKPPLITGKGILNGAVRALMSIRNVSFTYSQNNGTFLPGYLPNSDLIGMDLGRLSPGYGFVFGSQRDVLEQGIQDGWFSDDPLINQRVSQTTKDNLNIRATVEPFRKFRINLTASRQESVASSYFYQIQENGGLTKFSPQETGTFTITINSISTAFDQVDEDGYSASFKKMESYRAEFSKRLASENPLLDASYVPADGEFSSLYGSKQSEVLLYSFLAAYQGKSPSRQKLTPFSSIPIPNWSLNYTGLISIPFIKRYFSSFTVSHRYKSTLSLNGYANNLSYRQGNVDLNMEGNIETALLFRNMAVTINEQFGPLGKIDMRLKNSILANFEVRKSRTVGLDFGGPTVTEQKSFDIIVGGGYVFKDLVLPIKVGGKRLKSNLDLKANVGVKSSSLTLMLIDGEAETTQGAKIVNINLTADYMVTKQITVRAFYTQTINNPLTTLSYPTSSASGGLSIRFTL